MKRPLRIANASGFLGDRGAAWTELVAGEPVDVISGDYLAELTLWILAKQRRRDAKLGYAGTFLHHLEPVLGAVAERKIKVVVNAGGLNPRGLAEAVRTLCGKVGVKANVAAVLGDEVTGELIRGTKRHPTIEHDVVIYANATILGGRTLIGHHSIVGSSAWITRTVAPYTTVTIENPRLRFRGSEPDADQTGFDYQI